MSTSRRWRKAQDYERKHWEKVAHRVAIKQDDLDWYAWKARRLMEQFLSRIPYINFEEKSMVEIGSGPVGIITFLKGKKRSAIDPLSNFYEQNPLLVKWRDKDVEYLQGEGEVLPFPDGDFSLAIIDNTLDHTKSPTLVLKEVSRILEANGFLYLMVNVHTHWGVIMRTLMEILQLDKGHPHSYTQKSAKHLIQGLGFEIYYEKLEDYKKAKQTELGWGRFRNKLKVILGISDIPYEVLAKKR
jgi:ubiquinone/menaquinone biosynthesis C-methylase UbiE